MRAVSGSGNPNSNVYGWVFLVVLVMSLLIWAGQARQHHLEKSGAWRCCASGCQENYNHSCYSCDEGVCNHHAIAIPSGGRIFYFCPVHAKNVQVNSPEGK